MKPKHRTLLLVWGVNAILLALLAPNWWQGLIAGALIAAAAWRFGDKGAPVTVSVPPVVVGATEPIATVHECGQAELLQAVVPVWRNNVQLARSQTQEAIDRLTQRFVGIHQRLGGAMSLAAGGANGDVLPVIQKRHPNWAALRKYWNKYWPPATVCG